MLKYPTFALNIVQPANVLARFLSAGEENAVDPPSRCQLIILAGNAVLHTAVCALDMARQSELPILITGGIGHSTELLVEAVHSCPNLSYVETAGRSEAEILGQIARTQFSIREPQLLLETASTNCGQNADFSYALLEDIGMRPASALLIQDPLMQRRTDASFRQTWKRSQWQTRFANWSTFVPRLEVKNEAATYANDVSGPLWSRERFLSLIVGEIPRLRNDASGYGPNGRGFIAAVDLPEDVDAAHTDLLRVLADEGSINSRRLT